MSWPFPDWSNVVGVVAGLTAYGLVRHWSRRRRSQKRERWNYRER